MTTTGCNPKRIQLQRTKGWRIPDNTVKVDRSTRWGNPWRIGERPSIRMMRKWDWNFSPDGLKHVCKTAQEAVEKFGLCLSLDDCMIEVVELELNGKNLACWCPLDQPCHADVLLEVANGEEKEKKE